MMNELARLKPALVHEMKLFVDQVSRDSDFVSPWTADVMPRILDYSTRGKMIRGSLVSVGSRIFTGKDFGNDPAGDKNCLRLGVAMELIQSLLLIHDDIMDQDNLRRGKPSIHAQYVQLSRSRSAIDPQHLGESMGICAGDISGFLSFELIAALDLEPRLLQRLFALTSRELTLVGLAQMGDVFNGGINDEVGFEDIIRLYRYKTGRYTFSLPLMAGSICAGASDQSQSILAEIGELFGIIFQIKDDDLGLFGSAERTGKPVGSDVREDKKTLHRYFLLERADVSERHGLREIFGSRSATDSEIQHVLHRMELLGIREHIDRELDSHAAQARKLIETLPGVSDWGKSALEGLLAYNLDRET